MSLSKKLHIQQNFIRKRETEIFLNLPSTNGNQWRLNNVTTKIKLPQSGLKPTESKEAKALSLWQMSACAERWGGITDGSHLGGGASGVWEFMLPRTLSHLIDQKGRGPPAYSGDLSRPPCGRCNLQGKQLVQGFICAGYLLRQSVCSFSFISTGSREPILLAEWRRGDRKIKQQLGFTATN